MYNAEGAFTAGATNAAETAAGVATFQASFGMVQPQEIWNMTNLSSLVPAFHGYLGIHVPGLFFTD